MDTNTDFKAGDRVLADGKPGVIVYVRMAAPDYVRVEAASVKLDARANDPGYSGSVYPVSHLAHVGPVDYRSNVSPDVELSTGAIIRHERIASGAQRAFVVGSDREMTSAEWNEYAERVRGVL